MLNTLIDKNTISQVREKSDIVKVVEETVSLKKSGNSWKGLCPFHEESSPSMHVTPSKNLWHCFGCGEGGDVIEYVKKRDALTFTEAVENLAEKAGLEVSYTNQGNARSDRDALSGKRLTEMNNLAQKFFQTNWAKLPPNHVGKKFFVEKKLNNNDTLKQFNIGWAPHPTETPHPVTGKPDWSSLCRYLIEEGGYTAKEIVEGGLGNQNHKGEIIDKFRGRIMWPVSSPAGKIVGFGGRKVYEGEKEGPKYLNSPETILYKKSDILYNLDVARKHAKKMKNIIVVEGYTDVMALTEAGFPNTVAACGTAFGATHFSSLRRVFGDDLTKTTGVSSSTIAVTFMFDGDEAGKKAALRTAQAANSIAAETYALILPEGEDPSDMIKNEQRDSLRALAERKKNSRTLIWFAIETKISNHNTSTPEGLALAAEEAADIISTISNPITQNIYLSETSKELNISEANLKKVVQNKINQQRRYSSPHSTYDASNGNSSANTTVAGLEVSPHDITNQNPLNTQKGNPNFLNEEETLLVAAQNPQHAYSFYSQIKPEAFTSPLLREVHRVLAIAYGEQFNNHVAVFKEADWPENIKKALTDYGKTVGNVTNENLTLIKRHISALLVQEPKTIANNEEDLRAHTDSVLKKTLTNYYTRQIMELKQQQITESPQSETYMKIWEQILQLEKLKKDLSTP